MKKLLAFVVFICSLSFSSTAYASNEQPLCVPTTDKLYLYDFSSKIEITNHGGVYDSSNGFQFDYTRNCKVSPITKILVEDNFGITEYPSSGYGSFRFSYTTLSVSNCWQISRLSAYGESEQSNKVCYIAPVIQPVSVTGIFMYLNSSGAIDGDVYIKWTKGNDSSSLYWTVCPASPTWNPVDPAWSWEQTSSSGQTIFTGAVSEGVRCYLVSAKNGNGVLSLPTRVEYTYAKWMAQPYSVSPKYIVSNPASAGTYYRLPSAGTLYGNNPTKCVGICYGVPSSVNGLPRNTLVNGYFKANGTWVNPYTRSKP